MNAQPPTSTFRVVLFLAVSALTAPAAVPELRIEGPDTSPDHLLDQVQWRYHSERLPRSETPVGELTLRKPLDEATPTLMRTMSHGQVIERVRITSPEARQGGLPFYPAYLELAEVTVTSQSIEIDADGPRELVTLRFATIHEGYCLPNSPPTGAQLSSTSIREHPPTGTPVGRLIANDIDLWDRHEFTLVEDAGGRFSLDGDLLVAADSARLDFEADSRHTIAVTVRDEAGERITCQFEIRVEDVDDGPFDAWRRQHFAGPHLRSSEVSGYQGDPDRDGVSNLVEYALGGNPGNPGDSGRSQPRLRWQHLHGEWRRTLKFVRRTRESDPLLHIVLEHSSDLVNWTAGGGEIEVLSIRPTDPGLEEVTLGQPRGPHVPSLFFSRLRVQR